MSHACKSWDLIIMGGLEQTSLVNTIFLFMAEVKARWKAILTWCLKIWMQKDKNKWSFNHLSKKRLAHSLMKWSISCLGVLCTSMGIEIKWCPSWSPFILANLSNGVKFGSCTYWSTNDIWSHHFPRRVNNHHIGNEDLILSSLVQISS
jgi:hypothetical protein